MYFCEKDRSANCIRFAVVQVNIAEKQRQFDKTAEYRKHLSLVTADCSMLIFCSFSISFSFDPKKQAQHFCCIWFDGYV